MKQEGLMNKLFCRVWSHAKQTVVVTSELATGQGKKAGRSQTRRTAIGATALACGLVAALPPSAHAQALTIERNGDTCTVRSASGEAGTPIDCRVFEQANVGVAAVTTSGYLAADGAGDGSDLPTASGNGALAAGRNSAATADGTTAVGSDSAATGLSASAFGASSMALGDTSTAGGFNSIANGVDSSAYGANSYADGAYSTALGGSSLALGTAATAVGEGAVAAGEYSTAGGYGSVAAGDYTVAQGEGAQALGSLSTALGAEAYAGGDQAISIGAGSHAADYATATGTFSQATGRASSAYGAYAVAAGDFGVAFGAGANSGSYSGIAIGNSYVASGADGAIAMGANAGSWGVQSIAIGAWSTSNGNGSVAIGGTYDCQGWLCIQQNTSAGGVNATAIGSGANGIGIDSVALGGIAQGVGNGAVAIGSFARAWTDNSVSIGANSWVMSNNSVALGSDSLATRDNTVSVGNEWFGTTRQITGVADGTQANDAVNKSQLDTVSTRVDGLETQLGNVSGGLANAAVYDDAGKGQLTLAGATGTKLSNLSAGTNATDAVNFSQLSSVASVFGGGTTFDANGMLTAPSYTIQGVGYGNFGATFGAIDNALTGLQTQLSQLQPGGGGASLPVGTGNGLAIGNGSHANDIDDTAVGNGSTVGSTNSTAVGNNSSIGAGASNSVAVGSDSSVTANNGTAIGQGASVTADGAVAIGQGSVADRTNTVSVGSAGQGRQITNVAAGTQATDAVNLSQMQAGDLAAVASAKTYTDTTATQTLQSANAYTDSRFKAWDDQLAQLNQDVWNRLGEQDKRIDREGAMNAAMMNMAINAAGSRTPRGRVAVGAGWQNGESALSVGYSKQIGERASFSLGGAFGRDDQSAGIGFGYDL
jgi:autotransporter adhesin